MRIAFFPGCVSRGACRELYQSITAIAPVLGLELVELKEAACTGAGVLSEKNPELADALNTRTFALAQRHGLPLMNICSTCQGVMSQVQAKVHGDPAYLVKINALLRGEALEYKRDGLSIKNLLWVLLEDIGLEKIRGLVRRPLRGLRVAPFYGCYILRPSSILGFREHPARGTYLEQVIAALGAEPVDFSGKTKCCGFPILTMNRDNSLGMAADHLLEARGEGADCMVTPCPLCHLNLDANQPDAEGLRGAPIRLPILHLPQLLGMAFGIEPKSLGLGRHMISLRPVLAKVGL